MFIYLATIVTLNELIYGDLNPSQLIHFSTRRRVECIKSLTTLNVCINPLFFDEIALKKPIVQLDLSETFKVMISSIDELLQYPLQKVSHKVMMVDEYLQKIFDSHNLLSSELQVSVLLAGESISMSSVKYHGLDNTECNIADVLHRNNLVIVFSTLDNGDVGAGSGVTRLVFTLFEQFRAIHL